MDVCNYYFCLGLAIFVQKPLVPAYWLLNQDDLGKHEKSITHCDRLVNVPMTNVNTFLKEGQQMAYYLFLLPENCLAYDLETDEEPSHLNRPLLLNGRRLESCSYEVGAKKKPGSIQSLVGTLYLWCG